MEDRMDMICFTSEKNCCFFIFLVLVIKAEIWEYSNIIKKRQEGRKKADFDHLLNFLSQTSSYLEVCLQHVWSCFQDISS